ncbi:MAG: hypothetical protein ACH34U_13985, partial [Cyanobium sp.]
MAQRSAGEEGGSQWGAQGCQPCWRFWAQTVAQPAFLGRERRSLPVTDVHGALRPPPAPSPS